LDGHAVLLVEPLPEIDLPAARRTEGPPPRGRPQALLANRTRLLGHSAATGSRGGAVSATSATSVQLFSRSSATSIVLTVSSRFWLFTPSVSIVMQKGQALAIVVAPVSRSWSVRFT